MTVPPQTIMDACITEGGRRAMLNDEIAQLPPELRRIMLARTAHGLNVMETASVLEQSPAFVVMAYAALLDPLRIIAGTAQMGALHS